MTNLCGVHDLGGRFEGGQPIDREEHTYAAWELRADALMMLLGQSGRRLLTVDEVRRNIESLGAEAYDELSYYERWMHSIVQTLIQRGVLGVDEIGRQMEKRS